MIKKILVSLALLATQVAAMAQFQLGANMGGTISGTNISNTGRQFSSLGAFYPEIKAGYGFNQYLSANLGVGYAQRGFCQQPYGEKKEAVDLSFFTFPVYATGSLPLAPRATVGVSAGLQFSAFCGSEAAEPFNVRYQEMNAPVGFLCGAQLGFEVRKNLNLELVYRLVADFNNADSDRVLGRLHSNFFMLGFTYIIEPKEKAQSAE